MLKLQPATSILTSLGKRLIKMISMSSRDGWRKEMFFTPTRMDKMHLDKKDSKKNQFHIFVIGVLLFQNTFTPYLHNVVSNS